MNSTAWIAIGVLVVAGGLIFLSNMLQSSSAPAPEEVSTMLNVAADDNKKGAEGATVVLVEYLDFECSACASYYPIVKQMEGEFGDRVQFITRYFPLSIHRNGMTSALAAEAAARQGKFSEMQELLFSRQKEWGNKQVETPEVFEAYAQELGLDVEKFKADVVSAEVKARVKRDADAAIAIGAKGTPTFFLDGVLLSNPQSPDAFRTVLESALAN